MSKAATKIERVWFRVFARELVCGNYYTIAGSDVEAFNIVANRLDSNDLLDR